VSALADTMAAQPGLLEAILADPEPVDRVAGRLAGRRVLLVGTGTSFHAAQQGAALLRRAGLEAWAVPAADAALGDPAPGEGDALVLLSHRGWKRATSAVLASARDAGVPTIVISGQGSPGAPDIETTPQETSATFTASHLGALSRLAQLAVAHGADVGPLADVPDAVRAELAAGPTGVGVPPRLLQYAGVGINAWTAAEGALKIAEAAFVASEGLSVESVIHGPSAALAEGDALVCLDGGGPGTARVDDLAALITAHGAAVHRFTRPDLGEQLSIFPLTVVVQKIALEASEALGTNPDTMGRDLPGRDAAWASVGL
jgi:glucosamine--fructose-6-phosphate aminotransferase (isomerizing)